MNRLGWHAWQRGRSQRLAAQGRSSTVPRPVGRPSLTVTSIWLFASLGFLTGATQLSAQDSVYRIGPGDRLAIQVEELAEINADFVVTSDGTVELPRVGAVVLREQTAAQAQESIRNRLSAIGVRDPTVRLQVIELGSRPVSVLGAVESPGNQLIRGSEPLFDVLLRSGGIKPEHGVELQVSRQAANGLRDQISIPVIDLVQRGNPIYNVPIIPGDRIHVPTAREITYFIVGEVETAGPVTVPGSQAETLLTAIARSGGLSNTASNKIEIVRRDPSGKPISIFAHHGRILAGREPDIRIESGDIITVKESFF